jgi:cytochrome c-type biogenesis protein CcsB
MKRLINILTSTRITLLLLLTFAASMAAATFVENDHGTATARALVYETWWFELIMLWMAVNFLAHLRQYRLFSKGKWPVGLFHIAFVVILLGAGVTRYAGNEGMIHIREGEAQDIYYSTKKYLQLQPLSQPEAAPFEKQIGMTAKTFEPWQSEVKLAGQEMRVHFADYIPAGRPQFTEGDTTIFAFAVTQGDGREDFYLKKGERRQLGKTGLSTNPADSAAIRIFKENGEWQIASQVHLQVMEMATQQMGQLHGGEQQPLKLRTLYQWEEGAFMLKSIQERAALTYVPETDEKRAENRADVAHLVLKDTQGRQLTEAFVHITTIEPEWARFDYGGEEFAVTYGPKARQLPFALYLDDFQLERYPGSQSPASYASEVHVQDGSTAFPYRIYMNNVLDYGGYRFYQASYDTDEMGTVLSINQDKPGTYLTYLGYLLLMIGMIGTLFAGRSRFTLLNRQLSKLRETQPQPKRYPQPLLIMGLIGIVFISLQATPEPAVNAGPIPKAQADAFGRLIVQDMDGRMKPLNTLAHEIVRKLGGSNTMPVPMESETWEMSPEQFLLAVQLNPVAFSELPLIKVDKEKSQAVFETLDVVPAERLSFRDFLSEDAGYKLQGMVEHANQLKPAERNEADKELLKTDERFNIFYGLLSGDFLRLFPLAGDENDTWYTQNQYDQGFNEEDGRFVRNIIPVYLKGLQEGISSGDWTEADKALGYLDLYQRELGAAVYPAANAIEAELLYNELQLGSRLFAPFWGLGLLMLVLAILFLFYDKKWLHISWQTGQILSWLGLLVFTFHLGLRWYIAKRPPWTDGFEMLVFVAWGLLLFGLLFARKTRFTLPLGLIFSGTLLFVAFLDWLNPEITNLMPVLHSYWLKIHVAIIVSSYAPLALAATIGLMVLLLIIFRPGGNQPKWVKNIKELTIVNELSVTAGLFLLTIGTFLGGVWANESWGRYWAWDPKETWALISIIVYAIVLHLRLIPKVRNALVYNLASLWAFSAILMTSFGVNYYLSGLHSYAKGDPVPVPGWVFWAVGILLFISTAAIVRYKETSTEKHNG